jgi:hypothetical protein
MFAFTAMIVSILHGRDSPRAISESLRAPSCQLKFFKPLALPLVVFSLSTLFKDAFADIPRLFPGLQALPKCLVAGAC